MPLTRRIIALLLLFLPLAARGQAPSHEYRPELIITLPRWHGAALALLEEQHLHTTGLDAVERQHGVILSAPRVSAGVASLELRQVVAGSGLVEHRYVPSFSSTLVLAPRVELRNRVHVELRDIAGTWSQRYQERVTLARTLTVGHTTMQPYGHLALSYDSRYATISRREVALGFRLPLADRQVLEPFLLRQTDTRRPVPTIVATGLTMRVAL
jgi:hypothetical protein